MNGTKRCSINVGEFTSNFAEVLSYYFKLLDGIELSLPDYKLKLKIKVLMIENFK